MLAESPSPEPRHSFEKGATSVDNSDDVAANTTTTTSTNPRSASAYTVTVIAYGSQYDIPVTGHTRVISVLREVAELTISSTEAAALGDIDAALFHEQVPLTPDTPMRKLPRDCVLHFHTSLDTLVARGKAGHFIRVTDLMHRSGAAISLQSYPRGESLSLPRATYGRDAGEDLLLLHRLYGSGRYALSAPEASALALSLSPTPVEWDPLHRMSVGPTMRSRANCPTTAMPGNPWGLEERGPTCRVPIQASQDYLLLAEAPDSLSPAEGNHDSVLEDAKALSPEEPEKKKKSKVTKRQPLAPLSVNGTADSVKDKTASGDARFSPLSAVKRRLGALGLGKRSSQEQQSSTPAEAKKKKRKSKRGSKQGKKPAETEKSPATDSAEGVTAEEVPTTDANAAAPLQEQELQYHADPAQDVDVDVQPGDKAPEEIIPETDADVAKPDVEGETEGAASDAPPTAVADTPLSEDPPAVEEEDAAATTGPVVELPYTASVSNSSDGAVQQQDDAHHRVLVFDRRGLGPCAAATLCASTEGAPQHDLCCLRVLRIAPVSVIRQHFAIGEDKCLYIGSSKIDDEDATVEATVVFLGGADASPHVISFAEPNRTPRRSSDADAAGAASVDSTALLRASQELYHERALQRASSASSMGSGSARGGGAAVQPGTPGSSVGLTLPPPLPLPSAESPTVSPCASQQREDDGDASTPAEAHVDAALTSPRPTDPSMAETTPQVAAEVPTETEKPQLTERTHSGSRSSRQGRQGRRRHQEGGQRRQSSLSSTESVPAKDSSSKKKKKSKSPSGPSSGAVGKQRKAAPHPLSAVELVPSTAEAEPVPAKRSKSRSRSPLDKIRKLGAKITAGERSKSKTSKAASTAAAAAPAQEMDSTVAAASEATLPSPDARSPTQPPNPAEATVAPESGALPAPETPEATPQPSQEPSLEAQAEAPQEELHEETGAEAVQQPQEKPEKKHKSSKHHPSRHEDNHSRSPSADSHLSACSDATAPASPTGSQISKPASILQPTSNHKKAEPGQRLGSHPSPTNSGRRRSVSIDSPGDSLINMDNDCGVVTQPFVDVREELPVNEPFSVTPMTPPSPPTPSSMHTATPNQAPVDNPNTNTGNAYRYSESDNMPSPAGSATSAPELIRIIVRDPRDHERFHFNIPVEPDCAAFVIREWMTECLAEIAEEKAQEKGGDAAAAAAQVDDFTDTNAFDLYCGYTLISDPTTTFQQATRGKNECIFSLYKRAA